MSLFIVSLVAMVTSLLENEPEDDCNLNYCLWCGCLIV